MSNASAHQVPLQKHALFEIHRDDVALQVRSTLPGIVIMCKWEMAYLFNQVRY